MNGHCSSCDVEKQCGYEYKPCDCCNYRKFRPIQKEAIVIQFPHMLSAAPAQAEIKEGKS